ncbi:MAG: hypothetical protein ACI9WS_001219 [Paraglaciecola psychrophila]
MHSFSLIPARHPEGYREVFANIYRLFAAAIKGCSVSQPAALAGIEEGLRGIAVIEALVAACASEHKGTATSVY